MIQRQVVSDLAQRYLPAIKVHLIYKKQIHADRADDML